jgi:hypothetical protein
MGVLCFTMFFSNPYRYILGLPFIFISAWYSFKELDKRMDIKGIIIIEKKK